MNDQHPALYSSYQWLVPTQFNIAQVCLRRWSANAMEGRRTAIHYENAMGVRAEWSYGRLADVSGRLANGLLKMGVKKGDRVAVVMPARPEAVAATMAILGVGAVLVPLSPHLGADAMAHRIRDAEARVLIADAAAAPEISDVMRQSPSIRQLIGLEFQNDFTLSWRTLLAREDASFEPAPVYAEDPAILLYTAGTTGMPKGVLHAHRVLIGILPTFVAAQNWFPHPNDLFWCPLDWTTAPGLLHGWLAVFYFGRPIVMTEAPARGAEALSLLSRRSVTNTLLLPSDLVLMQEAAIGSVRPTGSTLRAMMVAGDVLPHSVRAWAGEHFGVEPNEVYGLTEAPGIIGHSREKWPLRSGSMGRAIPGHRIALLDSNGHQCRIGSVGQLALNVRDSRNHPDPALFLSYWRNDALTQARYRAEWFLTGDMASMDEDGYYWYVGRLDDVFRSGGHRVSPVEIEECLKQHPAVHNAAVVPKPEGTRGHAIKAFVQADLRTSHDTARFEQELRNHVRERLSAWQVPQHFEFVDRLPVTSEGQVRRHVLRAREQQRSMLAAAKAKPRA